MWQPRATADDCRTRRPLEAAREPLPPYWALFALAQLRRTTVGILSGICAGTAFFRISVLLPKALVIRRARSGGRLRADLSSVYREPLWEGFYRVPDGDHRAALDDHLCAHRIVARSRADAGVSSRGGLWGRGHIFGESFGRLFAGGLMPFLMTPCTRSAPIFFSTIRA